MNSKDDPFGSDGRTVIKSARGPRPSKKSDSTVVAASSPRGASTSRTVLALPPRLGERRDKPQPPPLKNLLEANERIEYLTANPMLSAAAPVLMLLSHLRQVPTETDPALLARHLAALLDEFDHKVAHAGIDEAEARVARYVLCESVDDIIQALPGFGPALWLPQGMLSTFFRADAAGVGFFDALNRILAEPEAHCDLLELMHVCLSLGFEGQYRGRSDAAAGLSQVRRDVHDTLRYFRAPPAEAISPQWQGLETPMARRRSLVPLWAVAAAACAVVAGVFFGMRSIVTDAGEAIAGELVKLDSGPLPTIQHVSLAPVAAASPLAVEPEPEPEPVRDAKLDRIRAALARELAAGQLTVDAKGQSIVVELNNVQLFQPGRATLKPEFNALVGPIASALSDEAGRIRIVGHTDSEKPGRGSAFKSNFDLSVARARAVEKVLAPKVRDPARIVVEGKGEDEPIADNATPEGRARNRRVALVISRDDVQAAAAIPAADD